VFLGYEGAQFDLPPPGTPVEGSPKQPPIRSLAGGILGALTGRLNHVVAAPIDLGRDVLVERAQAAVQSFSGFAVDVLEFRLPAHVIQQIPPDRFPLSDEIEPVMAGWLRLNSEDFIALIGDTRVAELTSTTSTSEELWDYCLAVDSLIASLVASFSD
jgi:hypothetical protein